MNIIAETAGLSTVDFGQCVLTVDTNIAVYEYSGAIKDAFDTMRTSGLDDTCALTDSCGSNAPSDS